MLPISPTLCGALFSAVARTARGEFDLDEDARARLDDARNHLEDLSDLIGDFRPTSPGSWSRFLGRLMDYSFETEGRYERAREARRALGFESLVGLPGFLVNEVCAKVPTKCVYTNGDNKLELARLDNDTLVAFLIPMSDAARETPSLYRNAADTSRKDVIEGVVQAFWRERDAVMLDHEVDGPAVSELDLDSFHYHGDRLDHIEEWRSFRESGLRRNVLLQGPPGCGKSTLCCHAARELSNRTLLLTPTCFVEFNLGDWLTMLDTVEPTMVILDDVDRIQEMGRYDLKDKLRFFEEGFCEVPFVLFTSNDCSRLPEAMRRPGRIDQIIRFDEPSRPVRETIVRKLARREDIAVPDEQLDTLVDLLEAFSAAHVVEALRRAKVIGWDAYGGESLAGEGDQTFLLHRDFDCKSDWLKAHGFRELDCEAGFIITEMKRRPDRELVYKDDHEQLFRLHLPNGTQICFEEAGSSHFSGRAFYFRHEIDGRGALSEGIGELFWESRDAVLIDAVSDEYVTSSLPPIHQDYYGELLDCIDRWEQFRESGLRRNVLIQGPPGCGKSTFCRHAAQALSTRTVMLTPNFYDSIRCGQWQHLVELLRPEMVIIDDVDRVGQHSLDSKLRLFEEDHCDIPFVLFTSNDHTKLPRAMRRPGRIDQIIEVEPPDRELRWQLIREMASRVGTEVPQAQLPRLESILEHQSTAHLIEALRRGKVDGWDAPAIPGDTTFEHAPEDGANNHATAFLD